MPRGAYLLTGHDGAYALERFSCAPGPAGWRYVATREDPATGAPLGRLDVALDATGRAVRVLVNAGGWELRGGVTADGCTWRRGSEQRSDAAVGFTGTSPVWALAAVRLLRPAAPVRARLVRLGDEALATRTVDEGWVRTARERDADLGVVVETHEAADLATGERRVVRLVGDVVLDATGVVLLELDGPPTPESP